METISLNDSNGSININHYNRHNNGNSIDNDDRELVDLANIKMKNDKEALEYLIKKTQMNIDSIKDSLLISSSEEQVKLRNQMDENNYLIVDLKSQLSKLNEASSNVNNLKKTLMISITTDNNNSDSSKDDISIPKLFINDSLITNNQDSNNNNINFQVLDSISSPSQLISDSYSSSSSSSSPPPRTHSNDNLYSNIDNYNKNNSSNNITVSSNSDSNNSNSNSNSNSNNNNNNYDLNQNDQFNILNTSDLDKILSTSSPSSSSSSSSSFSSSSTASSVYQYSYPKSFIPYIPSNNNIEERLDALQIIKLIHFEYSKQCKDKTTSLDNIMYNLNLNPQPAYNNCNNNQSNNSEVINNNNLIRNQKKLASLSGETGKPPRSPEDTYLACPLDEDELSNYYSHSFIAPKVSKSTIRQNSSQLANEKNGPKVIVFEKNDPGAFEFKKEKVPKLKDSNINHHFNCNIAESVTESSNSKNCIGFNPNNNNFNTVSGNNEDVDHYYDSFHNTELLDEDVLVYDDLVDDTLNDDDTVSVYTHDSSTTNFKISPIISPNQQSNNNNCNNNGNKNNIQLHPTQCQSAMELTVPGNNNTRYGNNKKQHLRSLSHGIIKTPFTDNKLKTIQIFVPTEPYTCKLEITIEENVTVDRLINEVIELCIKEKRKIQYIKKQKLQLENNKSPTTVNNNNNLLNNSNNNVNGNNSNLYNKNIISPPSTSIVSSSSTSPITISNHGSGGSSTSCINSSTNSANGSSNTPTPTVKEFESLTFPFLIYTNHRDFMLRKADENGDLDLCTPPIIRTTEIKKLTNDYFSLVIHPKAIRDISNHPQIFRVYIEQSQKTSQTSNGKPNEKTNNGIKNSVAVIYKSTSTLQSIKTSICKKEKLELNLCVFMTMNNEVIQNEKITLIELNLPSVKLVYDQHKQQVHKSVSFVSEVGNAPRPITKKLGPIFFFTPDNICEMKQYVISKINKFGVKKDRHMEINKDKIVYSPIDFISTLPPPSIAPQNLNINTLQPQTLLQGLQPQTTPSKNNKFFKSFSSSVIKTPFQMISDISAVGTVINKPSSFYLKCNGKTHEYYSLDADEIVAKIQFIIRSRKEKLI